MTLLLFKVSTLRGIVRGERDRNFNFVFSPPQTTIGLQLCSLANYWSPLVYCVVIFDNFAIYLLMLIVALIKLSAKK
jgi:hypothetical protein